MEVHVSFRTSINYALTALGLLQSISGTHHTRKKQQASNQNLNSPPPPPQKNCSYTTGKIDQRENESMYHMSLVMRNPAFCICENKDADQQLISAFAFAARIVQFLYFLNPKFQASRHLMWLYSRVNGGPGRKPRRPVFSQRGSYEPRH